MYITTRCYNIIFSLIPDTWCRVYIHEYCAGSFFYKRYSLLDGNTWSILCITLLYYVTRDATSCRHRQTAGNVKRQRDRERLRCEIGIHGDVETSKTFPFYISSLILEKNERKRLHYCINVFIVKYVSVESHMSSILRDNTLRFTHFSDDIVKLCSSATRPTLLHRKFENIIITLYYYYY